jgi:hypothetical protein
MIERQKELFGKAPKQASFDGGFATRSNLAAIKALGVKDAAFHKRRGIEVKEMTSSDRIYKKLRNFRAGIEGVISFLKRTFGLERCTWRGFASFRAMCIQRAGLNLLVLRDTCSLREPEIYPSQATRRAHVDADGQRASRLTSSACRRVCRSILCARGPLDALGTGLGLLRP